MRFIRLTLWAAAAITALGAYIFAFPNSAISAYYGMPSQVPVLYTALFGYVLLVFSLMYAWLAAQPTIHRPMLGLGVAGKGGVFLVGVVLLVIGAVPASIVFMLSADAIFATIWLLWLVRTAREV